MRKRRQERSSRRDHLLNTTVRFQTLCSCGLLRCADITLWQAHVCDRVDGCWAEIIPRFASQYRVAVVLAPVDTVQQVADAPPHVWTCDRFAIQHRKTGNAVQA